jgi:hypothetical protein
MIASNPVRPRPLATPVTRANTMAAREKLMFLDIRKR